MREYWYFLPLIGVVFILMSFQISDYSINENIEIPDKITDLNEISEIELNGLNIYIKFDSESDKIFYSDSLKTKIINKKLILESVEKGKNVEIVIGTKNKFYKIKINGLNIQVNGKVNSTIFEVDGANVIFDENAYFEGREIKVDGTNVILKGNYNIYTLEVNGISTNINIQIANCNIIKLNGITVNADIKYKDIWDGIRTVNYDGISNDVVIRMKKENKGEVKSNKKIKIIRY